MAWIRPDSHTANGWSSPASAYDGNTGTSASYGISGNSWSNYLEMYFSEAVECSEIRIYTSRQNSSVNTVEFDIRQNSTWTNVYSGAPTDGGASVSTVIDPTQTVDAIRVRFYADHGGGTRTAYIHDTELYEEEGSQTIEDTPTGNGIGSSSITYEIPNAVTEEIERSVGDTESWEFLAYVRDALALEYIDEGPFTVGQTYYYRVRKYEDNEPGDWSDVESVLYAETFVGVEAAATGNGSGVGSVQEEITVTASSTGSGLGYYALAEEIEVTASVQGNGSGSYSLTTATIVIGNAVGIGEGSYVLTDEVIVPIMVEAIGTGSGTINPYNVVLDMPYGTGVGGTGPVTSEVISGIEVIDGTASGNGVGDHVISSLIIISESVTGEGVGLSALAEIIIVSDTISGSGKGTGTTFYEVEGMITGNPSGSGTGQSQVSEEIETMANSTASGTGQSQISEEIETIASGTVSGTGQSQVAEEIETEETAHASGVGISSVNEILWVLTNGTGEGRGTGTPQVLNIVKTAFSASGSGSTTVHVVTLGEDSGTASGSGLGSYSLDYTNIVIVDDIIVSGQGQGSTVAEEEIITVGYEIQQSINNSPWTLWDILPLETDNICYISNFENGYIYRYRIRRFTETMSSDWSNVITIIHDAEGTVSSLVSGSGTGTTEATSHFILSENAEASGQGKMIATLMEVGYGTGSGQGSSLLEEKVITSGITEASGNGFISATGTVLLYVEATGSGTGNRELVAVRVSLGEAEASGTGIGFLEIITSVGSGKGTTFVVSLLHTEAEAEAEGTGSMKIIVVEPDLYRLKGRVRAKQVIGRVMTTRILEGRKRR